MTDLFDIAHDADDPDCINRPRRAMALTYRDHVRQLHDAATDEYVRAAGTVHTDDYMLQKAEYLAAKATMQALRLLLAEADDNLNAYPEN